MNLFHSFLDIFSGASSPVSVAVRALHADSIEPVDLIFGQHCDLLDDMCFPERFETWLHQDWWEQHLAAPHCSKHSMATLRPNGPKAGPYSGCSGRFAYKHCFARP